MAATDKIRELIRRIAAGDAPLAEFQSAAGAIEHRPPPLLARGVLYLLVALLVVAGLWATFSHVDQIVIAQGRVITTAQTVVIQALETAVIREIPVRVGQTVKKGEILVVLDSTFSTADVAQIKQRMGSLNAEIDRLDAEAKEKRYSAAGGGPDAALQADMFEKRAAEYEARSKGNGADISKLEADLKGTLRSREALKQRLDSLRQIEKMKDDLKDKQFLSPMAVLESRERRLEIETAYEDSVNKAQQLGHQLAQARFADQVFAKQWRQKILEDYLKAQRERDGLQEQLAKAERRNALVRLVSPVDAIVLEINKRSVGSVAKEAEPLLTLVPANSPIEAEIQIAAEDVGFVRQGDPVRIKIDAFPFQKHGTVPGSLTVIGADSYLDQGAGGGPGAAARAGGNRAFFPGRVAQLQNTLIKVPPDTKLTPGMTLTAEIKIGERSVLSYFLYPLIKAFDESIRQY